MAISCSCLMIVKLKVKYIDDYLKKKQYERDQKAD